MAEALPKNFIDYEEYPQTAEMQNRCVSMIARMFNAPTHDETENAMGTSTVGSSEAIMLGPFNMNSTAANPPILMSYRHPCNEETLAKQAQSRR